MCIQGSWLDATLKTTVDMGTKWMAAFINALEINIERKLALQWIAFLMLLSHFMVFSRYMPLIKAVTRLCMPGLTSAVGS